MKTLAIFLIILFATPVFALDMNFISIMESDGVIYIIDDTPEPYVPPEPVDTSIETPEFINKIKRDPGTFLLDWGIILKSTFDALD